MQLRFASLIYSTWDYTLKSEFFAQPVSVGTNADKKKGFGFVTVETLISQQVLDPVLQPVGEYCKHGVQVNLTAPNMLADELIADGDAALTLAQWDRAPSVLTNEVRDVATWAHLSKYFGLKLLGAVALQMCRTHGASDKGVDWKALAVANLTAAQVEWNSVIDITAAHLAAPFLMDDMKQFNAVLNVKGGNTNQPRGSTIGWKLFNPMVQRDVDIAANETCTGGGSESSSVIVAAARIGEEVRR